MKKLFRFIVKIVLKTILIPVIKNNEIKIYVFEKILNKEVADYIENIYYKGYNHITKAVESAKKLKLSDNYQILDIGGSIGNTAAMFAEQLPKSTVSVFEPIQSNYSKLEKRFATTQNVKLHHTALGNETGEKEINIAKRISSSSLYDLPDTDTDNNFKNNVSFDHKETIKITTLDDVIGASSNISIMKIDVQGFEIEVLKGAENTLKNTHLILVEVANHEYYKGAPKYFEIDEYLRQKGFELSDIFPNHKENHVLQEWDLIYVNTAKL